MKMSRLSCRGYRTKRKRIKNRLLGSRKLNKMRYNWRSRLRPTSKVWIMKILTLLKSLLHCTQPGIHFAWWASEDQITDCVLGQLNITERAKNMDLGFCHHNSSSCSILDRKFGLPFLTADSTHTPWEMVTMQHFHVSDVKWIHIEIFEPQDGNCILQLKPKHIRL